jgi:hypothetical protein
VGSWLVKSSLLLLGDGGAVAVDPPRCCIRV